MAKQFDAFEDSHQKMVAEQHVFFVATAAPEGRVNLSPKGMDSLRILGPNRLIWLNVTGSGNETAGHLKQSNRMTVMWCSFTKRPVILRAYGTARTVHTRDADWAELAALLPDLPGARQIYDMQVDMVQSSCGYAVPFMEFQEERTVLRQWAEGKGNTGIAEYWDTRNRNTIDGFDTGIVDE
ncbi:pyridoxamine 5'-phosphate oxidase family protein [Epibacterium sp. SM1979]|uniref:Pyridoxamine 5'-phosphate oxidase family protein n=1 Tax=Tritonibacter litoralis TaxID=2662264 RepID=A0A843Y9A1_9RHOB|nr:pyridoxamine 5'-phosphate oxidase family protein [Tritonibacter litoralis]MQQ07581.1 pyridoxamine 5'-phosphate oxidase family protein [Tritonibacter litoralis]